MSDEAIAALVGGIMGILGGFVTIPLNTLASFLLKERELKLEDRLRQISDQRKLLLEHQLEKERMGSTTKIDQLEQRIARIESIVLR